MVGEVTGTGGTAAAVQTRATELEQSQRSRETTRSSRNEGVEVRINREDASRTNTQDLTYENLRPRQGGATTETNTEPREAARPATQTRGEEVVLEEAGARDAAQRENASEPREERA